MNLLKTLLFTVLVPGTTLGVIPYLLLKTGRGKWAVDFIGFTVGGVLLVVLGVLIYLKCAWDFATRGQGTPSPHDPPRKLVITGLYRYSRNPMYVGIIAISGGEALLFHSYLLGLYALGLALAFHIWIIIYEEPTLRRMFGEAYEEYCRRVPRWVGRRGPKSR